MDCKGEKRKRERELEGTRLLLYESKCGRKGHNYCCDSNYTVSKKNVACKCSPSVQR